MRSSRVGQFVTNLIGVVGLAVIVLGYFAVTGSGQEEEEFALRRIIFCSEPVGVGAITCNVAACKEDGGECKPNCAGSTCNVPDACTCMTTSRGCRCARYE